MFFLTKCNYSEKENFTNDGKVKFNLKSSKQRVHLFLDQYM